MQASDTVEDLGDLRFLVLAVRALGGMGMTGPAFGVSAQGFFQGASRCCSCHLMFLRMRQVLKQLDHPNICKLYVPWLEKASAFFFRAHMEHRLSGILNPKPRMLWGRQP